jgi:hypothetical protein
MANSLLNSVLELQRPERTLALEEKMKPEELAEFVEMMAHVRSLPARSRPTDKQIAKAVGDRMGLSVSSSSIRRWRSRGE